MADTGRRALVAALVAALGATFFVAGVGHIYLREWRRAVAWFTFVLGSGMILISVFANPETVSPATVPEALPMAVTAPMVVLLTLSIFDAYYLGRRGSTGHTNPNAPTCPHCGGEVDPSLDFCHWCTEPLAGRTQESRPNG